MLNSYSSVILLCCLALSTSVAKTEEAVRVMSFNIRYGTAPDGDNSWPNRKSLVLDVIRDFEPHLLGLQEALRGQLDELTAAFPQYVAIGVGREADGNGEYSTLLFDRSRFDLLEGETFWLSDTPNKRGSHNWGNELPRVCTWARLVDRTTGESLQVWNTHWDHVSQPARIGSGQLIADRIAKLPPDEPVILMGDFNVGPTNEARHPFAKPGLRESYLVLHPDGQNIGTFNGFQGTTSGEKIDAIFVNDRWKILEANIVRTQRDGRYPSDHFPVTATLSVK
ncbi:endonuclease/exonuclease/phosphatase family protein [Bythopirellula polymerisocia]|uniref:Endonuclease/Exonuclease/phosphatase family protein n=1 Tax=Bythopirellula polymerisocia TaxID=2528003 RepID=A0A5C6CY42_9BACT|nr:endonuclease/exonuclease/phosphatase family protein [Bythopirellula polymerisocia]TWU29318.1 Endonuclease/Exonuclease/phosphatase family protein [Bythopirellula polymerisocia]